MLNVARVRRDFPILNTDIIYMDSASSSLTPEPVLTKMTEFYHQYRANVDRGIHRLSQKASEEYEAAHEKVARFLNARSPAEIVMTRNTTEGLNLIANGLDWKKGDKIITTLLDHHSNFIIWQRVRDRFGVELTIVRPDRDGLLNPESFQEVLDSRTRLVTFPHVSNSLGAISPVKELVRVVKERGALAVVDAAQSVPHMRVNVKDINCDFLAFSGHKMCGPTGSGALYIREGLGRLLEPTFIGGGSIRDVSSTSYELTEGWRRFEAGTPAIAEGIGLGAAVDYLDNIGIEDIEIAMKTHAEQLYERLTAIQDVDVYGPTETSKRAALASFNVRNLDPHDVALTLDVSRKIMIRSGHHCALPTMKDVLNVKNTARASLDIYNTPDEIELLVSAIEDIRKSPTSHLRGLSQ